MTDHYNNLVHHFSGLVFTIVTTGQMPSQEIQNALATELRNVMTQVNIPSPPSAGASSSSRMAPDGTGCPRILKSGLRKGQMCGAKLKIGSEFCNSHTDKGQKTAAKGDQAAMSSAPSFTFQQPTGATQFQQPPSFISKAPSSSFRTDPPPIANGQSHVPQFVPPPPSQSSTGQLPQFTPQASSGGQLPSFARQNQAPPVQQQQMPPAVPPSFTSQNQSPPVQQQQMPPAVQQQQMPPAVPPSFIPQNQPPSAQQQASSIPPPSFIPQNQPPPVQQQASSIPPPSFTPPTHQDEPTHQKSGQEQQVQIPSFSSLGMAPQKADFYARYFNPEQRNFIFTSDPLMKRFVFADFENQGRTIVGTLPMEMTVGKKPDPLPESFVSSLLKPIDSISEEQKQWCIDNEIIIPIQVVESEVTEE